MARRVLYGKSYVIGVLGSSVAAGHDNCNFDSYERQLERTFQPVMAKAGAEFTVRNAGQGGGCGDDYKNQVWCLRHTLGEDIDEGHFVWTYFGETGMHEELYMRWLLRLPHRPALTLLHAREKQPACNPALLQDYGKFGFNGLSLWSPYQRAGMAEGFKWKQVGDGPSSPKNASRSLRRALLMPQVSPGSRYCCGKSA